ncbi:MAG: hypothetical protein H7Z40_22875 [Phycisphaerae bacterium]|nr:hypothetical protein [Gemmatimonadaceae bacterium]
MLRIEQDIPGFGGFYQDTTSGDIVAFVTDMQSSAATVSRLNQFVTDKMVTRKNGSRSLVTIRQGEYSLSTLIDWQVKLRTSGNRSSGIVLLDADEHLNRLRVAVSDSAAVGGVLELAQSLGIPVQAIVSELRTGQVRLTSKVTDKHRPQLGAGIAINQNTFACTMGFNVTDSTGARFFLTASHCTQNFVSGTGDPIFQRNWFGDFVGNVIVNPAWSFVCSYGSFCRMGDVALVTLDTSGFLGKRVAITQVVGNNISPAMTTFKSGGVL